MGKDFFYFNSFYFYRKIRTQSVYEIKNHKYIPKNISNTFHGRDIYAPTAAALLKGIKTKKLLKKINDKNSLIKIKIPKLVVKNNVIFTSVLYIDIFGNVFTNIKKEIIGFNDNEKKITLNNVKLNLCKYYNEIKHGDIGLIFGSSGYLEIFINQGDAGKYLKLNVGDQIEIKLN